MEKRLPACSFGANQNIILSCLRKAGVLFYGIRHKYIVVRDFAVAHVVSCGHVALYIFIESSGKI